MYFYLSRGSEFTYLHLVVPLEGCVFLSCRTKSDGADGEDVTSSTLREREQEGGGGDVPERPENNL